MATRAERLEQIEKEAWMNGFISGFQDGARASWTFTAKILLDYRFGPLSERTVKRIDRLSRPQMYQLLGAALRFEKRGI